MQDIKLGRRERKKLAVRDKIIEETMGLLARHGIDGVTIDAICDCADIAKKTFYTYYGSKHELLVDICNSTLLHRTEGMIADSIKSRPTLAEQLDFIINEILDWTLSAKKFERELIDYSVRTLSENIGNGASQLKTMNDSFLNLFESGKSQLNPELTPKFCAEMTVGMINAVTLNWLHSEKYDAKSKYKMLLTYLKKSMLEEVPLATTPKTRSRKS